MQCPVCHNQLDKRRVPLPSNENWEEMRVDICRGGCGGIWFDRFELDKVDEPDEIEGEKILDVKRDDSIEIDHDRDRECPQCDDIVMMKKFFSVSRKVEIDECGGCAGIWLDANELERMRDLYDSEEEREEAFNEYYEKELAPQLAQLESERSIADNPVVRALRFITPSYWIPGDQDWAAY